MQVFLYKNTSLPGATGRRTPRCRTTRRTPPSSGGSTGSIRPHSRQRFRKLKCEPFRLNFQRETMCCYSNLATPPLVKTEGDSAGMLLV